MLFTKNFLFLKEELEMVTTKTKKSRGIMDIERRYREAWAGKEYKAIERFIEKERARERRSYNPAMN